MGLLVTSHLAHFYGEKPVFPGYEPVAEGKRVGEDACGRVSRRLQHGKFHSWWSVAILSKGRSRPNFCSGAVRVLSKRGVKKRVACRPQRSSPRPLPTPPPILI